METAVCQLAAVSFQKPQGWEAVLLHWPDAQPVSCTAGSQLMEVAVCQLAAVSFQKPQDRKAVLLH